MRIPQQRTKLQEIIGLNVSLMIVNHHAQERVSCGEAWTERCIVVGQWQ